MTISFFNITFHLYGFIIAIAIFIAIFLSEMKSKKLGIKEAEFWNLVFWILLFGILGARIWHVFTDFRFYQNDLLAIFKIWHGGLSILGAILGGVLALKFKINHSTALMTGNLRLKISLRQALDLAVFGLPFGQAVGRLANYFNQELYGLPTNLPWGIFINPEFRIARFATYDFYHPLFAYEAILMLVFGLIIWQLEKYKKLKIGSGKYFLVYLIYYSLIRFLLDFLRIDKALFLNTSLGINQIILLIILSAIFLYLLIKKISKRV